MTSSRASRPSLPAAVSALESHRKDLRRYFMRRLRCPNDADDLTQEVLLRFLVLHEWKTPEKPQCYVYGIAKHVLSDFISRQERDCSVFDHNVDITEPRLERILASPFKDPFESVALRQEVESVLLTLSQSLAHVLVSHEWDGYSYEEVAHKTGFTKQTVEKYLARAKAQLRWDSLHHRSSI